MPFVNGKFYMNPAYGRALEAARASEAASSQHDPQQQESGAHWVTIHGRHVLIQGTELAQSQQANHNQRIQMRQEQKRRAEAKAEVGYGETSGIVPEKSADSPNNASPYQRSTWDPASTKNLQDARKNIMDISERNGIVKKSKPDDPHNKIQQSIWQDNLSVAKSSQGDMSGRYFFIRQEGKGPQRPPTSAGFGQGKPISEYGPFVMSEVAMFREAIGPT
jgi:hypothetical protein